MFSENQEILITVIIGVLLILFLVVIFILSIVKYKRKITQDIEERMVMKKDFENTLLQSQVEVQESTLSTISKELHDNIGQLLSTVKMFLGITEINLINPPTSLITAKETLSKAITELRSLSRSLSKEWLQQFDLIKNLEAEVSRMNLSNTMQVQFYHCGTLSSIADSQIILFRIIQEAIQNAIKHSSANKIDISLTAENDLFTTIIKDNGKGFEQQQTTEGVGILNMKQRTKLLGGTIEWVCGNEGCTVIVKLPNNIY